MKKFRENGCRQFIKITNYKIKSAEKYKKIHEITFHKEHLQRVNDVLQSWCENFFLPYFLVKNEFFLVNHIIIQLPKRACWGSDICTSAVSFLLNKIFTLWTSP